MCFDDINLDFYTSRINYFWMSNDSYTGDDWVSRSGKCSPGPSPEHPRRNRVQWKISTRIHKIMERERIPRSERPKRTEPLPWFGANEMGTSATSTSLPRARKRLSARKTSSARRKYMSPAQLRSKLSSKSPIPSGSRNYLMNPQTLLDDISKKPKQDSALPVAKTDGAQSKKTPTQSDVRSGDLRNRLVSAQPQEDQSVYTRGKETERTIQSRTNIALRRNLPPFPNVRTVDVPTIAISIADPFVVGIDTECHTPLDSEKCRTKTHSREAAYVADTLSRAPKLHPMLAKQKSRRESCPGSSVKLFQCSQQEAPIQKAEPSCHPNSSHTSHPPPLGMRRTHTIRTPTQPGLPTRQKPFKPPTLSQRSIQEAPKNPQFQSFNAVSTTVSKKALVKNNQEIQNGSESGNSKDKFSRDFSPDTSYGDMSLDPEDLEKVLKNYD